MSNDDLEEFGLEECEICGGHFLPEDLNHGICDECDGQIGED